MIEKDNSYKELGKTLCGKTSEGIEIEMSFSRNSINDKWKIASAYIKQSYIRGT